MPEILTIIKKRRSVRKFTSKKPSGASLKKILEAGRWAPSGLNNQPWRFLVIKNNILKEQIAELTKYGSIIRDAPCLFMIFMDIADSYNRDKDLMAIGACIQNMLLEAASLQLGACWLGEILNKKKEVFRLLRLDNELELMAVVALGYPLPSQKKLKGCRKQLKELLLKTA